MHERDIAGRLRLAFDIAQAGIAMQAARFRRENTGASEAEIARLVRAWLEDRPCNAQGSELRAEESRFARRPEHDAE